MCCRRCRNGYTYFIITCDCVCVRAWIPQPNRKTFVTHSMRLCACSRSYNPQRRYRARTQKNRRRVRSCMCVFVFVSYEQKVAYRRCLCAPTSRLGSYRCGSVVVVRRCRCRRRRRHRHTMSTAQLHIPNIFQYSVSLLLSVVRSCCVCVAPIHFHNLTKEKNTE